MRKSRVKVKNDLDQVLIRFSTKKSVLAIFVLGILSNAFVWGAVLAITVFLIPARGWFEIIFMIFWLSIWIPGTLALVTLFLWNLFGYHEIKLTWDELKISKKILFLSKSTVIDPKMLKSIRLASSMKRLFKKIEDLNIDNPKLEEKKQKDHPMNYIAIDHYDGSYSLTDSYPIEDLREILRALKHNNFIRSDVFNTNNEDF